MGFGERVRQLRKERELTQQKLADQIGVSLSYVSKVENERLNVGDYPSEAFVHELADALAADEDELLILTGRVPERVRKRVVERIDLFAALAEMSDRQLERIVGGDRAG